MKIPMLPIMLLVMTAALSAQTAQTARDHLDAAQREILAAQAMLPPNPPASFYTSISDHVIRKKPAPPTLGAAGFAFLDPTFGSQMWRVTDPATSGGSSLRVQSNAHAASWNSEGSKFFVLNEGGAAIFYSFDGTKVSKLSNVITSQIEPTFSYVDPNVVFGVTQHTVRTWSLATGAAADVVNLDQKYPALPLLNTYVGGIVTTDRDQWVVFFGGGGQDQHVFIHHSIAGLLDLRGKGWKIHSVSLERTGRYVFIYPAINAATGQLPLGVAQVQVWDTQNGSITPITNLPAGHDSVGYGVWINADCCSGGTWDASQWQVRSVQALNAPTNLIPSVLTPQEVYLAEHSNWRSARSDQKMPFVSASYRYGDGVNLQSYPWRAWDEEVIAVSTDGSGIVWRFAHTQTIVQVPPGGIDFWSEPIINCAASGRFCIFTSNWGVAGGREDVFLVELR